MRDYVHTNFGGPSPSSLRRAACERGKNHDFTEFKLVAHGMRLTSPDMSPLSTSRGLQLNDTRFVPLPLIQNTRYDRERHTRTAAPLRRFVTVASDSKPLADVLVDPWGDGQRGAESERNDETCDVRSRKDECEHCRAVATIPKVWPVSVEIVEGGGGHREGHRPEGQFCKDVSEHAGDANCLEVAIRLDLVESELLADLELFVQRLGLRHRRTCSGARLPAHGTCSVTCSVFTEARNIAHAAGDERREDEIKDHVTDQWKVEDR
mmetsp:Transcript_86832/g.173371  ORF Transcript_86832/g.173371 Transcript_86832/m.173371 type:complete len:265 (-) Transcript_86832:434-1228(-)